MANLTVTVDGETLRRARIRALERHESVNAYLAEMLRRYAAASDSRSDVVERLAELADRHPGVGSNDNGRTWSRDELHRV